jgi:hypothetical protein
MTGDRDHLVTDGPFAESKEVALAGWIRPAEEPRNWSPVCDVHWTSYEDQSRHSLVA